MKKALITGANGFVGSHLCRHLLENGYQVRAMHRASSDLSTLSGLDLELIAGDVRNIDEVRRAVAGQDVVFHIAALFREAGHPDSVYYDVNVQGVKNVFDAAIEAGVKKVIHCSTIGVHSHIPDPPANEEEEFRPGDVYQNSKYEGEKLAQGYYRSGKIGGAIIRPAMIWGPGDKRTLKLFRGIARGTMPLIGTGKTLVHWILVTDLVRAFRLAAEKDVPAGRVFIIAGDRPLSMQYLYQTIAGAFSKKPPWLRVPALPLQILGSIMETICVPFGIEPPLYRRRVDFFTKTRAFDCSRAKKELGFLPEHSFEDEVAYIAGWYKEQGWI